MKKILLLTPLLSLLFLSHPTYAMEQESGPNVKFFFGKIINSTDQEWNIYDSLGNNRKKIVPHHVSTLNDIFKQKGIEHSYILQNKQNPNIGFLITFIIYSFGTAVTGVRAFLRPLSQYEMLGYFEKEFTTDVAVPLFGDRRSLINKNDEVSITLNLHIELENNNYTAFFDDYIEIKHK